ncbi:Tetratricopeptide repeat protein 25 [Halocaridina rubra]|uniref:Tetratricopeptide repeat protein 25 n=1 Tax=Halocaridina rubra TaxID=373956 RepID=A0AAN9A524_HALRR
MRYSSFHKLLTLIPIFFTVTRKPSEGEADEENTLDRARAVKMVSKFFQKEVAEQKQKVLGYNPEGRIEIYTDKNRAAAVALGDEDIKTSIKVKRKREKKLEQPEDTNSTVHITEAVRAISQGRITTALSCAEKAVEGSKDPEALVVRGRCHLLLGNLQKALEDSRTALKADSKLVKGQLHDKFVSMCTRHGPHDELEPDFYQWLG